MAEQQANMKERFLELIEKYKSPTDEINNKIVLLPDKTEYKWPTTGDRGHYYFKRERFFYQIATINMTIGEDSRSISIETFDNSDDIIINGQKSHKISIGTNGVSARIGTNYLDRVTGQGGLSRDFSYTKARMWPAKLTTCTIITYGDGNQKKETRELKESEETPIETIWEATRNPINVQLFQDALSVIELRLPGITEFLEEYFPEYSAFIGTQNTKNARQLSTQKA